MKILHLINYFNDGLDYQENFLTQHQANDGHNVKVITSDRFYPFVNYNKIYFPLLGKRVIDKKEYNIKKVKILRKKTFFETKKHAQCLFFNLFDIIRFNPDIIHIHNTGTITFITTFFYCNLLKKKLFIDCHSDFQNTNKSIVNTINNIFWKFFYNFFKNTINKFLPINDYSKNYIIKNYKINQNKIEIIPLGFSKFNKIKTFKINNIKNKFNFKKDDIIIFNSGKMNENKKIFDLIKLLEFLLKSNKNFKLLLVGDSPDKYSIKLKMKIAILNSKFKNSIKWIGFQKKKNLRNLMCISDIAIWPGTPSISIQEALYCENILFLPKTSASYHLIDNKILIFHNDDILRTSRNILKIFKKKVFKNSIIKKNNVKLKKLSWNIISKKLIYVYENS